ncbi:TetR/AcrR family transcriptional regulator [Pseudoduganella ginsengisoli]|uniref:TetR family transcriptional regulator n=1 Tax=Pseudoduganella ginsengisoli TaxID=1462440 RepID=A0A6L6PW67_9BURK|nr:TetR/AcrR family transcriptional regulator [Pseudoduganella ginsengisoli]MTW01675.1 TetR family transcriptional regulator [Pseudoduganella ginsengisoli]
MTIQGNRVDDDINPAEAHGAPRRPRIRHRGPDKYPLILNAARRLVAQSGFRDVQMSAVADAAGIAIGTLYRYFPAKIELMMEVVDLSGQREIDVVAGVAMGEGSAAERLGAAAWTFASRALRGRRMAHALVAEPVEPEVEAVRMKYHRALSRVFVTIIEQGMRGGEFPAQDAQASADCIVGCLFEGLVGPLALDAPADDPALTAQAIAIISFCLRGVCGSSCTFVPPR